MQNEEPILTIGIPTWNRADRLLACIRMWAAQISEVKDSVEIFVSDNGSTDGTAEILQTLGCEMAFLRYSRNAENIGADRNFLEVFRKASGKYVWLFSDDDLINKGALAEILRVLKTHQPSHLSTNFDSLDTYNGTRRIPDRKHMVSSDVSSADLNTVFLLRNSWLSFMTCNVYRRDLLDIPSYESQLETVKNWIQLYVTAHVLTHGNGYLSSYYAVSGRDSPPRYRSAVIVADLPETFDYVLRKFCADDKVRSQVLREMRPLVLPFRVFLRCRALCIMPSPLLVPWYYKLAFAIPRSWLSIAWKTRERLSGRLTRFQEA